MKQLQKPPKEEKPRKRPRAPLEEGIVVPTGPAGRRRWSKINDEDLLTYTRKTIKENGITGRSEFQKKANGLYLVLLRRKLLNAALEGIKPKQLSYPKDPDKFVEYARLFIRRNGITGRSELQEESGGLYTTLLNNHLLDAAFEGIKPKQLSYPKDPDELVKQARQSIRENGITGRNELRKKSKGLYSALGRKKLLDAAFEGIDKYPKDPDELVKQARQFIRENGIT